MSRTGTGCRRNIGACALVSAFAGATWSKRAVYENSRQKSVQRRKHRDYGMLQSLIMLQ